MGWKQEFSVLRERLIKKSKSPGALDKQVQILANKLGLTSREALFVLANSKGIGYQADFKRLSREEQSRISQAVAGKKGTHTTSTVRIFSKTGVQTQLHWYQTWWGLTAIGVISGVIATIVGGLIVAHLT
jgi:hypothetical protein